MRRKAASAAEIRLAMMPSVGFLRQASFLISAMNGVRQETGKELVVKLVLLLSSDIDHIDRSIHFPFLSGYLCDHTPIAYTFELVETLPVVGQFQ